MGGVADQEHVAEAHRFGDEAAQRSNALLDRRACDHLFGDVLGQTAADFVPEALVRPVLDLLVQANLDVVAAAGVRTHRAQRKAALVVGVDQFFVHRRRVGQEAQPAEGIDALVFLELVARHRGTRSPVVAVAAGDVVAVDDGLLAVLVEFQLGLAVQVADRMHIAGFEDDGDVVILQHGVVQVLGELGLAVHHHLLAAGQRRHVDAFFTTVEGQHDAVVQ
ncbi:hypothetical protein SDC9_176756 [bioreactor metagenome]|uniref:NAD-specific glutamate dehydrogenase n=1 Tax=bioreactor metagenome TaxID=1076179 RepID=A0A645GZ26_9ZZZZ